MLNTLTAKKNVLDSPIDYAVLLVVITLPLNTKLNGISIILLCISVVTYAIYRKLKLERKFLWLFCMPFLFDLIGLIYTNNLEFGLEYCVRRITILLFPLIFSFYSISRKKLRIFLYTFILLCTFIGLICLLWAIYQQVNWSLRYDKWEINWFIFTYHTLVRIVGLHAVYFSIYVGFCISFLTIELFQRQSLSTRIKSYLIILLAFNFLILLLLSSRMPIVATLIIFFGIVNYFLWSKSKLVTIGVNIILILALILAVSQLTILKERLLGTLNLQQDTQYIQKWGSSKGNISVREQKWHGALLVIKENPIFGTGSGDLDPVLIEKYKEIGFQLGVEQRYDPHNQLLNTTARTGVFSGLTFLLIFLVPMGYCLKKRYFLFFAFLFIVFCVSLTESVLSSQKGIVFYSLFNSLILSSIFSRHEYDPSKLSRT